MGVCGHRAIHVAEVEELLLVQVALVGVHRVRHDSLGLGAQKQGVDKSTAKKTSLSLLKRQNTCMQPVQEKGQMCFYGYGYGFKLGLYRSPTSLPLV